MAIYPYKCEKCGLYEEVVQSISSYCEKPSIPSCSEHGLMGRFFTVPMMAVDIQEHYLSPLDGKTFVTSRTQEREHMARHGVVKFDDIAPDFERNRKAQQEEMAKGLKSAIIESVQKVEAGYKPTSIPESALIPSI